MASQSINSAFLAIALACVMIVVLAQKLSDVVITARIWSHNHGQLETAALNLPLELIENDWPCWQLG